MTTLLVVCGEPVILMLQDEAPAAFEVAGKVFSRVDVEYFAGFYDWLRDDDGLVIGVRLYAMDETKQLVEGWHDAPGYVRVKDGVLSIYFLAGGLEHAVDAEDARDDQCFAHVATYRSADLFAFGFDLGDLDDREVDSLRRLETLHAVN